MTVFPTNDPAYSHDARNIIHWISKVSWVPWVIMAIRPWNCCRGHCPRTYTDCEV